MGIELRLSAVSNELCAVYQHMSGQSCAYGQGGWHSRDPLHAPETCRGHVAAPRVAATAKKLVDERGVYRRCKGRQYRFQYAQEKGAIDNNAELTHTDWDKVIKP